MKLESELININSNRNEDLKFLEKIKAMMRFLRNVFASFLHSESSPK